jgi:hypothetical protein
MAFSPCPKCQDKAAFDKVSDLNKAAFVIVTAGPFAAEFYANKYVCNRNPEHVWNDYGAIRSDLKKAGYLG